MKADTTNKDGIRRIDGRLKVTGSIKYAAEYNFPGLVYGAIVASTIAKGRITDVDSKEAQNAPGVLKVISHLNAPDIPGYKESEHRALNPFTSNEVFFNGQPIVLVIADTFERAKHAASLIKVKYQQDDHQTDLEANLAKATKPSGDDDDYSRGTPNAYRSAQVKIEAEYRTPIHVHNPMEPFAVTAFWEGNDKVTLYTKSQYIKGMQHDIVNTFKLKPENVQVYSKVIGGAFGSGSPLWPYAKAALIGARVIGKPLKTVLDRQQMFGMVGYRSPSVQKLGIGTTSEGKLVGITHEAIAETSTYQQFTEGITSTTTMLYDCPNINTSYKLARLDLSTPTYTRGPGETTGVYALESAIDEMAYALNMDPLEFRRKNYSDKDLARNLPWSSKYLNECYDRGAERFGWDKRNQKPGSVTKDGWLVGYGMSSGVYGSYRAPATVRARLSSDGVLLLQTATSDMGPGTGTAMVRIASEIIDIPVENIHFELGSSALPPAPGEYGSMTTASVGTGVYDACTALKEKFGELAGSSDKPDYTKILKEHNLPYLEVTKQSGMNPESEKYSTYAYHVFFAEVHVHPATGMVKVKRVVSAVDGGRIINPVTARSQIMGGVVWGISMALMEGGVLDHRFGRYVNNNLAEYHVPVNQDIPEFDVIFINKKDPVNNPMGSKGIGEVGIVGVAAGIANAVFNATGIRVRDLPITPDKLI
jgi:xanthine dehydrogenase YagR molybdenum-binding subunit